MFSSRSPTKAKHRASSSSSTFSRSPVPSRSTLPSDLMPAVSLDSPPSTPSPKSRLLSSTASEANGSRIRTSARQLTNRVERWIEEYQHAGSSRSGANPYQPGTSSTFSHYLAYPDLEAGHAALHNHGDMVDDDTGSFVFVVEEVGEADEPQQEIPKFDTHFSSHETRPSRSTSRLSSPSIRSIRFSLSSARRQPVPPLSPSSRALFPRPTTTTGHNPSHRRGESASAALLSPPSTMSGSPPGTPPRSLRSPWKLRRPSVFSTFAPSPSPSPTTSPSAGTSPYSNPADFLDEPPSRPSFNSSRTFSSSVTMASGDPSSAQGTSSRFHTSSQSLWSLPVNASHQDDHPDSEETLAHEPGSPPRKLVFSRSSTHTLRGILPVVAKPRKILVVSGISRSETDRVEDLREWCEQFGEVRGITRAPNGDVLVDFKKAEVADTVCRVTARVVIPKVGSVGLNYKIMKKR